MRFEIERHMGLLLDHKMKRVRTAIGFGTLIKITINAYISFICIEPHRMAAVKGGKLGWSTL
jgi:hypothetical protein